MNGGSGPSAADVVAPTVFRFECSCGWNSRDFTLGECDPVEVNRVSREHAGTHRMALRSDREQAR